MLQKFIFIVLILFLLKSEKSNCALQDSAVWLYTEWTIEGYISYYASFRNDTIINNTSYKILKNQLVTIPGLFANPWIGGDFDVYWRYDSISIKVYDTDGNIERLLYDYSMNVGDTLYRPINPYILISIDSVQMENLSLRKRFIFTNVFSDSVIWIKGVGNIMNPIEPTHRYGSDFVLCYHEDQTLIYQYQNLVPVQCDNYSPVNEVLDDRQIQIYPNPFKNIINFNSAERIKEIEVYDVTGQILLTMFPNESNPVLDLSKFENDIFFLKIKLNNGIIVFRKVIKIL